MTMRPSAISLRMEPSERITAPRLNRRRRSAHSGRQVKLRGVAAGVAAAAGLAGDAPTDRLEAGALGAGGIAGHAPVEEPFDQVDLVADGIFRQSSRFMASGEPPPWREMTEYQPPE